MVMKVMYITNEILNKASMDRTNRITDEMIASADMYKRMTGTLMKHLMPAIAEWAKNHSHLGIDATTKGDQAFEDLMIGAAIGMHSIMGVMMTTLFMGDIKMGHDGLSLVIDTIKMLHERTTVASLEANKQEGLNELLDDVIKQNHD